LTRVSKASSDGSSGRVVVVVVGGRVVVVVGVVELVVVASLVDVVVGSFSIVDV
jgi:hypothetical protein